MHIRSCDIFRVVLFFALLASAALPAAAAPVISDLTVANVTTTTATVTWTTDVPATSQVIMVDNAMFQPLQRYPEPVAPTLATRHTVTLTGLIPSLVPRQHNGSVYPAITTRYTVYVASRDAEGNLTTSMRRDDATWSMDKTSFTTFQTLAIDPTARTDFALVAKGAKSVYAGSDLYLNITVVALAGELDHVYFNGVQGLSGAAIEATLFRTPLPLPADKHVADTTNSADTLLLKQGEAYPHVYTQVGKNVTIGMQLRLRTAATTPPGSYTATITLKSNNVVRSVPYTFTVKALPKVIAKKQQIGPYPAIPHQALWENTMTTLGDKWCFNDTYNKALREETFFNLEHTAWYYDGARIYQQIGAYTGDSRWDVCANHLLNGSRSAVLTRKSLQGWRLFPHGFAMDFWKTGNPLSRQAAVEHATKSAFAPVGGSWDPWAIRETAFLIGSMVTSVELGEPRPATLTRAVDYALGIIDQNFVSNDRFWQHIFMDGLLAEALISYYEMTVAQGTSDPRIPPSIKIMLDWIWYNAWDRTNKILVYNPIDVPLRNANELIGLVVPAFAWYGNLTGDAVYQQRGDELFAAMPQRVTATVSALSGRFTLKGHTFAEGDLIKLYAPATAGGATMPTGLYSHIPVYVSNVSGDTFTVAKTDGGNSLSFTSGGTVEVNAVYQPVTALASAEDSTFTLRGYPFSVGEKVKIYAPAAGTLPAPLQDRRTYCVRDRDGWRGSFRLVECGAYAQDATAPAIKLTQSGSVVLKRAKDISDKGKTFAQNFRWTFDYIRWRSGKVPAATAPPHTVQTISLYPAAIVFDAAAPASATQSLTIANTAGASTPAHNLTISSWTVTNEQGARFAVEPGDGTAGSCGKLPVVIPAGQLCTITLKLMPSGASRASATLLVSSDDPRTPVTTLSLRRTASPQDRDSE